MADASVSYDADALRRRILTLRGQKVILDTDLAGLYGVEVKRLNEQVKRNRDRFPEDFIFQLTAQETADLKSQVAISSEDATDNRDGSRKDASRLSNWSQFATSSAKHRGLTYRPWAFTEHGAIMAATVLNSPKAVEMSVFVVRAFVKLREQLLATAELAKRLAEVEKDLLTHDAALRDLYQKIRPLLLPAPPAQPPVRKPIGFGVKEARVPYGAKPKRPLRR